MKEPLTELEFYVPVKTVSEANARGHWRVRHERGKSQRKAVGLLWGNATKGRRVAVPCVVRLVRIGPKALDPGDNLSSAFKAIRDEIAARLGVDDGSEMVRFEYDQVAIGERSYNVKVQVKSL